jgi:hypothetical protein
MANRYGSIAPFTGGLKDGLFETGFTVALKSRNQEIIYFA